MVTNNHVVASAAAEDGKITVIDHAGRRHEASVVGRSPVYDLALLLVDLRLWPILPVQFAAGWMLGWLRENVHRHGAKYEPQVLVQRITGSKIDPQPYVQYLRTKYSDIYGL